MEIVFGLSVREHSLWRRGFRKELIGILLCIVLGFIKYYNVGNEISWRYQTFMVRRSFIRMEHPSFIDPSVRADLLDMCEESPPTFVGFSRYRSYGGIQRTAKEEQTSFYQSIVKLLAPIWQKLFNREQR